MKSNHLLDRARLLARRGRHPRDGDLKMALATISYALFHFIARRFAGSPVGAKANLTPRWGRVYRTMGHGRARGEFACEAARGKGYLLDLAEIFVEPQELRHQADDDPTTSGLTRIEVFQYIWRVAARFAGADRIGPGEWAPIATRVLFKDRA